MESLIIANAHKIISGEMPDLSSKTSDFFMLKNYNGLSAAELVVELCAKRLPDAYGYNPLSDIQVLCPSKMLDLGSISLNNISAKHDFIPVKNLAVHGRLRDKNRL